MKKAYTVYKKINYPGLDIYILIKGRETVYKIVPEGSPTPDGGCPNPDTEAKINGFKGWNKMHEKLRKEAKK